MYNDISCIILSGGKSTRMGENKSFLKFGTETVIEGLVNLVRKIFSEVMIITNEQKLYQFPGVTVYSDIFQNAGPIAGIH